MAPSGLQETAKVLGAACLFGVTSAIGSPIAGVVVTSIGGPVLEVVSQHGVDYAVAHWPFGKGAPNHDLHKAMQTAFAKATVRLEIQWREADAAKRLTKDQRTPVATFFATFKQDIAWIFSDDQTAELTAGISALKTDHVAQAGFQQVIDGQLRRYLHGHDEALYEFMRRRLLTEATACFVEELKTNDRAWRAWQLLLNEGLQTSLAMILGRQDQTAADLQRIQTRLAEFKTLATALCQAPSDQRNLWGADALNDLSETLAILVREETVELKDHIDQGNAKLAAHIDDRQRELLEFLRQHLASPNQPPPVSAFNVPLSANPNFTGRDEALDTLAATGPAETPLVHAITGLGGVGKSQFAAEFAHRHRDAFPIIWWVRAEDPATLVGDFAELAGELGLPIATMAGVTTEQIAEAVRAWLQRTDRRWLLIFDNAGTPRDLQPCLPTAGDGRVLITSRLHTWGQHAAPEDLPVLSLDDAAGFLLRRTGQTDTARARDIADALGCLPLALEQAGAYMDTNGISFEKYRTLVASHAARLLGPDHRTDDTNAAVTTTWRISIEAIKKKRPTAVDLLTLCAWFAPDMIPIDVIMSQATELPRELAEAWQDPLDAEETAGILYRYSLIDRVDDRHISIHRLVQLAVRESLTMEDRAVWAGAAVRLLQRAYPFAEDDPATWRESERLLPHALAACDGAHAAGTEAEAMSALLDRAASYLQIQGQFSRARDLLDQALASALATFGPNHPTVATDRSNLGGVLQDLGDLAGARTQLEQALESGLATFGPDHPEVATRRNNLGLVLRALGDLAAPAHSSSRRWKAASPPSAPTTPPSPPPAATWGACSRTWATWPGRAPSGGRPPGYTGNSIWRRMPAGSSRGSANTVRNSDLPGHSRPARDRCPKGLRNGRVTPGSSSARARWPVPAPQCRPRRR